MIDLPFLRPRLPDAAQIAPWLQRIDDSRRYSNFGPLNQEFEARCLAHFFDGRGAVTTVCNATIGLMLAIRAVQRPNARYALMPSFTFAATPLAAQWCGLEPWFVDIDPDTWCARADCIEAAIDRLGDELAVVVAYATFGRDLDLSMYSRWMARGIPVVIDAAPCLGTRTTHESFGIGFAGPVVFSLHATKAFAIGEGGLIYSADPACIADIRKRSNYGFDAQRASDELGLNAKLSEHAAAVALCTFETFDSRMQARMVLHRQYLDAFDARGLNRAGWRTQSIGDAAIAHQFMPLLAPASTSGAEVVEHLADHGIEARTYFSPACHEQPQFSRCPTDGLMNTREISRRIVSLPLWEDMDESTVERVADALAAMR